VDPQPVVLGLLYEDGRETWWLSVEPPPRERSGAQRIEVWSGGQLLGREWADVSTLSDGRTLVVRAPLPDGVAWADVDALVRVDHRDRRFPLARADVRDAQAWAQRNRVRAR
jgi:hypothetical protein